MAAAVTAASAATRSMSRFLLLVNLIFLYILPSVLAVRQQQSSNSHYKTLGIDRNASPEEIKKAYHKACLKHHPDKGGKEETFKEITKAHEILSDPEKKKMYDVYGAAAPPTTAAGGFQTYGFANTASNSHSFYERNPFYTGDLNEGFSSGIDREFVRSFGDGNHFFQQQQQTYGDAGASHRDMQDLLRQMRGGKVPRTKRSGSRRADGAFGLGPQQQQQQERKVYERAVQCSLEDLFTGATKKLKVSLQGRSRTYTLVIKPGCTTGAKYAFKATRGFPAITFVVQEKKHLRFERRGDDLVYMFTLPSSLPQVGNLQLDIQMLDGTIWSRSIPWTSMLLRKGQLLTIADEGMPLTCSKTGQRGNLIIKFC
jgi:DnaJ-class molecular chaperone